METIWVKLKYLVTVYSRTKEDDTFTLGEMVTSLC